MIIDKLFFPWLRFLSISDINRRIKSINIDDIDHFRYRFLSINYVWFILSTQGRQITWKVNVSYSYKAFLFSSFASRFSPNKKKERLIAGSLQYRRS